MNADISTLAVRDLIPHADPMVLLDRIESWHKHGLVASLTIREDSLFAEAQGVPAWIGLEYMGQAIAAFGGLGARQHNLPVRIGFLVSTRRYQPQVSHFPPGALLTVAVNAVTFNTTGLRVFECAIHCQDEVVVTANLNVYMPEDVTAFMEDQNR
jgi:predicted hotdog family 3-hydroxylacyl-ACP dehydratase